MSLSEFHEALPSDFAFYHLGTVRTEPAASSGLPRDLETYGLKAVAFSIYGDSRGVAVAIFASDTDESIFTELGNTLASRFADSLAAERGMVMVSPPVPISASQYLALRGQAEPVARLYSIPQGELHFAFFPSPALKENSGA